MPSYTFVCESCGHRLDTFLWFSESLPASCPQCGAAEEAVWHQAWGESRPAGWTYGEDRATTVGQQAEINMRRLGKEKTERWREAEQLRMQGGKEYERPWWRQTDELLDLEKVRDTKRYIETGQKT